MDEIDETTKVNGHSLAHRFATEDRYGDDELNITTEDSDTDRPKRRSRRIAKNESVNGEVSPKRSSYRRQSSSEDEVNRGRHRTPSSNSIGRRVSSSEDDTKTPTRRVSSSRRSVSDRKSSFEQSSNSTTAAKRSSFSSRKSHTTATTDGGAERKRESFSKSRTISVDSKSPRKASEERPAWSSSTKVEHNDRKISSSMSDRKYSSTRKESTTQSESDEPKSASQLKAKWESRASGDSSVSNKTKAFGGTTGAAAMRQRFENPSSSIYRQRRKSSSADNKLRTLSQTSIDGDTTPRSAASLKARFEAKNTEAAPVRRNFVINKGGKAGGLAKKFGAQATSNKCAVCGKTVYPMEKLEANGVVYHKFCFRCATCNRTLGLGNYAALEGKIYCKPHLKQLFKLKGNYDEGFGRAQRKADWVKKDESAESSNPSAANNEEEKPDENGEQAPVVVNGNEDDEE